jgi:hypothetical protein
MIDANGVEFTPEKPLHPAKIPRRAWMCRHKDTAHKALGLCSKCYRAKIRRDNGIKPRIKQAVTACEHTDRPHVAHGLCRECYMRYRYRKDRPNAKPFQPHSTPMLTRFMDRVEVQPNGCWFWKTGAARKPKEQGSYPIFVDLAKYGRSPVHAVKWAYENIRGLEAPKRDSGLELSHTCESGSICVNPDHVTAETHKENMQRSLETAQRSAANARAHIKPKPVQTHCLRGHARTPSMRGKRCYICMYEARKQRNTLRAWVKAIETGKPMKRARGYKNYVPSGVLTRGPAPIYTVNGPVNAVSASY